MKRVSAILAAVATLATFAIISVSTIGTAEAARKGSALSQNELRKIYRGKTWLWKDGGGYFKRSGRFHARSGVGRKFYKVNGGWGAYRRGKVCFSGTWKGRQGDGFNSTCFYHKKVGGKIYQKRGTYGDWYIFKHARVKKNDEYKKIVSGNWTRWYQKYANKKAKKRKKYRRYKRKRSHYKRHRGYRTKISKRKRWRKKRK